MARSTEYLVYLVAELRLLLDSGYICPELCYLGRLPLFPSQSFTTDQLETPPEIAPVTQRPVSWTEYIMLLFSLPFLS